MSKNRLAILPNVTHYDIFLSPALVPTVLPFVDGYAAAPTWEAQKFLFVTNLPLPDYYSGSPPPIPGITLGFSVAVLSIWAAAGVLAAFLVFGMQVGFTMLEAGFCRSRETVNVLMECIVDTCLCGLLFYAFGFAFMFSHGNGFIGYHWFFLQGAPATYESTGVAFLAVWIFQFAFADTCSTITSGAMIGRTGFVGEASTAR